MLDLLKDGPLKTGELCSHFPDLNRCTVMQHLGVLEQADLIMVKRQGRYRFNYLNPLPIKQIHDRWIQDFARRAVGYLDELKTELEAD